MVQRIERYRRCFWQLVAAFAIAGFAHAQQFTFRTYGIDRGLNNLGIKQLYQDKQGFLWVSTEGGVYRYDGEHFQAFGQKEGLPASNAAAIGEAPDGSLLLGGQIGLFHKVGERFEPVGMPGAHMVSWYRGIQFDGRHTTWIATEKGMMALKLEGGRFDFKLQPKPAQIGSSVVNGLLVEGDRVWYGCDQQICRLENGVVTVYGLKAGVPLSKWKGITRARNGDLWVQGRSEVARMKAGTNRFELEHAAFQGDVATGMPSVDSNGSVIFGTNDGLTIRQDERWVKVGRHSGLKGFVYCTLQDREGSLWIGLLGRGLVRWVGYREWEAYTTESGLGTDVIYQMLPVAGGGMWVTTEEGLYKGVRTNNVWSWKKQPQFAGIAVHSITPDGQGRFWLGTESRGAARFSPATGQVEWFTESRGLKGRNPYILTLDRNGRIWAATDEGLFQAELSKLQFRRVQELPAIQTWSVVEAANGDIWAGTVKGLYRYSGGTWSHFTLSDGLRHESILSIGAAKNGEVWIGYQYQGGVDRVRFGNGRPRIVRPPQVSTAPSGTTYFIGFDRSSNMWVGTDRGVNMWDGAAWSHYDSHDGLVWDDCDLNGFAAESDGSVWIGTSGGLARLLPHQVTARTYTPEVVYTKTVLGTKQVDPASQPTVDHSSKTLYARFSTLVFAREDSVLFRYRLLPLFDTWHETKQREVQFDGLEPAKYRLEVMARDGWGHWSAAPAAMTFEILTPWWRGPWVIPILLTLPALLVVAISRIRGAAMRRRERKLIQLVEARTAELREANAHLLQLTHIEHEKNLAEKQAAHAQEIAQLNRRAIITMALAIEAKDQTTGDHLHRVEVYAIEVARKMQLTETQMDALRAAAILHDIGKLAVPEHIISKPGRLTPEEFETMKIHPVVGGELVERMQFPYAVAPIVRAHHERWDGSGYPDGLAGEQIPIGARILSAVDCLDALSSDRQYRRAMPLEEAIRYIQDAAGKSFDPAVVEVLAAHYVEFEQLTRTSGNQSTRLSTDIKVNAGQAPAAGFQKFERDLVNLSSAVNDLNELSTKLGDCTSTAESFEALSSLLGKFVPYDAMVLYIRHEDQLLPEFTAGGEAAIFASCPIPLGTGLSGWVAENRKTIINGNPSVEPAYLSNKEKLRALASALSVPVLSGSTLTGVLSLYSATPDAYTETHLTRLVSISAKIAPAVQNPLQAITKV